MKKSRSSRTKVDTNSLAHQVTQISKMLGVTFKGGNNYYRYETGRGEQLTISAKDGFVLVALHGLSKTPRVATRAPQHLGIENLTAIIRKRLDLIAA